MPPFAGIFIMIGILGLLIAVHELGHFLAARLQGIHVNRFSIGFGPVLWKYQGEQTEYALRSIPLGGYVGFPDEDPESSIPLTDPDLMRNRPVLDRAIVISAGVIANMILAYVLLVAEVGIVGVPGGVQYQPGVLIAQVATDVSSVAANAGIQSRDIVLAVDGQPLGQAEAARDSLMKSIQDNDGQPIQLHIKRQDQELDISIIPERTDDGLARIGVQLAPNGRLVRRPIQHVGELFGTAAQEFQKIVGFMAHTLSELVGNFRESASQVAGPVGIVAIGADMARTDMSSLFQFAAVISVNLAFINILPLPALDGGQLAFLLLEGLRGKPLPNKIQEGVMQVSLFLLLGLGVFMIVLDTAKLMT
ncbi:RIP metalloprotease RseP [Acaryochloris sp. CCMEE 5410]|uniref:RIP metalloprotease RseP n=1 Tax=Acaryochloris sp. CCMEE 5410 TaxID=310037 RepID=UPI00024840DD|nr:RIP metalloprotease RseP [Acaryochloris sp. CCMEE 5410]KAI9133710.1 RIP metalloprotease RseP [Acaryochloris sp. CCMEE 5410]